MEKEISPAVISRMPRYYRYLGELLSDGVERISSGELSLRMHVTASQIRQDLNNFGGFGQQGYGYNVQFLYDEIGRILGLDSPHNVILIGVGNLGQAIANYVSFENLDFSMIGLFDINREICGKTISGVTVRHTDELKAFVEKNPVDIAILTLPKEAAETVARQLVDIGIKAIWNFAQVDLLVPDDVIVQNVHLSDSLMQLSYNLKQNSGE